MGPPDDGAIKQRTTLFIVITSKTPITGKTIQCKAAKTLLHIAGFLGLTTCIFLFLFWKIIYVILCLCQILCCPRDTRATTLKQLNGKNKETQLNFTFPFQHESSLFLQKKTKTKKTIHKNKKANLQHQCIQSAISTKSSLDKDHGTICLKTVSSQAHPVHRRAGMAHTRTQTPAHTMEITFFFRLH